MTWRPMTYDQYCRGLDRHWRAGAVGPGLGDGFDDFPSRVQYLLRRLAAAQGIYTSRDVLASTPDRVLLAVWSIGPRTLAEIRARIPYREWIGVCNWVGEGSSDG